jgi:WG containing repeat
MKRSIFVCFVLVQCIAAFSQQYLPDYSKDYPFSDTASPFVFQKKILPGIYQQNENFDELEEIPPPMELVGAMLPDTTKETFLERIYRIRLQDNYQEFFLNGKKGIKDARGEEIIPAIYDQLHPFGYVVLAQLNNKYGVLDGKGGIVLPFGWQFHEMSNGYVLLSNGKRGVVYNEEMELLFDKPATEVGSVYSYTEQLSLYKFKDEKGWQVFDINGNYLFRGYFDGFMHFKNSLFALSDRGSWWLFSLDGKKLTQSPCNEIIPFSNKHLDVFVIRKDSLSYRKYYVLNAEGKVISNTFDNISTPYSADPDQDWVRVSSHSKLGILNYKGEVVVPVEYDKLEDGYNGYVNLWKAGKIVQWVSIETGKLYDQFPVNK